MNILRWLALLPASVVGSVVVAVLLQKAKILLDQVAAGSWTPTGRYEPTGAEFLYLLYCGVWAYAFVEIGVAVAPAAKRAVRLSLCGLLLVSTVVKMSIGIFLAPWSGYDPAAFAWLDQSSVWLIGDVVVIVVIAMVAVTRTE